MQQKNTNIYKDILSSFISGDIRNVAQPYMAWSACLKYLIKKIVGHRQIMLRVGAGFPFKLC